MGTLKVECLRCGMAHLVAAGLWQALHYGECPRCRYVGWAATAELDELTRRVLRDRPVESRRLRAVA